MIGWIGVISYHMQLILSVMELTILCAFICKIRYFDAQVRETLLYK